MKAAFPSLMIPTRRHWETSVSGHQSGSAIFTISATTGNHDIIVEKALPLDPTKAYPLCITGRGECPKEDSGGPYLYMARRATRISKPVGAKDRFDPDDVNVLLRNLQSRWFKRAVTL
jgi:hypothetical protein